MTSDAAAQFEVLIVHPLSSQEVWVTGRVRSGALHTGECVSFTATDGIPCIAIVKRIGTSDIPLKVIREGQKTSLVLEVEPQDVRVGVILTSSSEDDAYAPTVVVPELGEAMSLPPDEFLEIEKLVDERQFSEALAKLNEQMERGGSPLYTNRLLARVHLEADHEINDKEKALEHIKRAYESGGENDADVLETLAQALGANGRATAGLRFLERLYSHSVDFVSQKYYEERIVSYRQRHRIPDMWEIIDATGEVVFSTSDLKQVQQGIESNTFPTDAKCKKNRIGKLVEISEAVKEAGARSSGVAREFLANTVLRVLIGGVAGGTIGVLISLVVGIPVVAPLLVCFAIGAAAPFGVALLRSKR